MIELDSVMIAAVPLERKEAIHAFLIYEGKAIIKRPYLNIFFESLVEKYTIGIYSRKSRSYVNKILEELHVEKYVEPSIILCEENCIKLGGHFIKDLGFYDV